MSTYQWLLALHVTSAFFYLGGGVSAGVLNLVARGRERPSEIATVMRLEQLAVIVFGIGIAGTLVFGLWLVHEVGFGYGELWIWSAVLLWVIANALGGAGGKRERAAAQLAVRLAAEGDAPSEELRVRLHDRATALLNSGSALATILILVLMIWKPGA